MLVLTRVLYRSHVSDESDIILVIPPSTTETRILVRAMEMKSSDKVRIALEAPNEVVIYRRELAPDGQFSRRNSGGQSSGHTEERSRE